jgi:hypothetical protein
MIDPITGKNYNTIDTTVEAHDPYNISDPLDKMKHNITYSKGYTSSPNSPIYVNLKSGMRDYYTGPTSFSIPNNSWMDVNVH